ncbi:hypothetical protein [Streptomyces sp. S.PB5]|uniref:HoxN/HupN/NixA family nickel/cobalt transporter n=1 Tax=Streptomyces sp. S.PB5 TaxID=3020844 RepID=UPI00339D9E08
MSTAPTAPPPPATDTSSSVRRALTRAEWSRLGAVFGFIAALHIIGWGILLTVIAPHHFALGQQGFGVGVGVTAYVLGMRHAFDADHIAAIDNTTRKLMNAERRPLTVGFWFSLGHSSIVFALSLLLAFGVRSLAGPLQDDDSTLHNLTSWIGTLVSGAFLYAIAILNLAALAGIWRIFRAMRHGRYDETELQKQLDQRGFKTVPLGRSGNPPALLPRGAERVQRTGLQLRAGSVVHTGSTGHAFRSKTGDLLIRRIGQYSTNVHNSLPF